MPAEQQERPLVADRYRLDGVIGNGAVGRVWRGEDTVLRRPVAIKEVPLPDHLAEDERQALRARVLREAQAAARIHHPGSVQVFDVVDSGATIHLVMELVDDRTLAEVVGADGPLSVRSTAAMGAELLGALEAAHQVGIVHRDVKPRNVMVLPTGGVKLADFGIASVRDDPGITKTGMVLGTPSYMSPEQAVGEAVGPPTDVWGTGALLYYAVEGEAPFDRGETIATLHAVVHSEPRAYRRAGALAPVLDRLLVKDPSERISLADAKSRLSAIAAEARDGDDTVAVAGTTRAAPAAATAVAAPTAAPEVGAARSTPPPPRPPRRDAPPRRALPWALVAAVLGVLVVGGIALAAQDDGDGAEVADPTSTSATSETTPSTEAEAEATTTAPPTTGAPEETSTTTSPPAEERPEGVPASWQRYTEPSLGWSVWHPPAWQPAAGGSGAVDFTDPSTGSYLRVDSVQPPGDDPVEAWEEASDRFEDTYDDYEELRIEPTTYQGFDAAVWEYTYEGQRATNLGFVTPDTGYALNFQAPAAAWEDLQEEREAFEAGFTPP